MVKESCEPLLTIFGSKTTKASSAPLRVTGGREKREVWRGDRGLLVEAEHTLGHLLLLNRGLCVWEGSEYLNPVGVNWSLS